MNPQDSHAAPLEGDLSWQAFLYVGGDLSPDEVVDFEERLLTDQVAREAVAEAAKISEGLWLASAMDSLSKTQPAVALEDQKRNRARWVAWLAGTFAAACLAFYVGGRLADPDASDLAAPIAESSKKMEANDPGPSMELDGAGELLAIWTSSKLLTADLESGDKTELPAEYAEDVALRDAPSEDDEFAWMLVALSANSTDPPANPLMEN